METVYLSPDTQIADLVGQVRPFVFTQALQMLIENVALMVLWRHRLEYNIRDQDTIDRVDSLQECILACERQISIIRKRQADVRKEQEWSNANMAENMRKLQPNISSVSYTHLTLPTICSV